MQSKDLGQPHRTSALGNNLQEHLPRTASLGDTLIYEDAVKAQAACGGCFRIVGHRLSGQGGEIAPRVDPALCSIFIMLELGSFNHTSAVVAGSIQHT